MLSLNNFSSWVNQQAAAAQASCAQLLDFSVGTVNRALAEANASVALWFQWLLLLLLARTRAATSNGSDLDTWCADFGFARLSATFATGVVTFSRFTTTSTALIVPGLQVKTTDGTQYFTVTTDTTNALWNVGQGGYLVPIGTTAASVPVVAVNGGTQGNVQANTITLITAAVSGIDTCNNAAAFVNGIAGESDAAFRLRFVSWVNSRSLATKAAIGAAILGVQQNLTYSIQENVQGGGYAPGAFIVTIDDGSGYPSSTVITAVTAAVELVRPLGSSTYTVQAPSVVSAAVAFTLSVKTGYVKANMVSPITTAITAFINALPLGAPLPYSRLPQVIYDATPGVANVTNLLLNGAIGSDLGGGPSQVVRSGSVVIS